MSTYNKLKGCMYVSVDVLPQLTLNSIRRNISTANFTPHTDLLYFPAKTRKGTTSIINRPQISTSLVMILSPTSEVLFFSFRFLDIG